MPHPGPYEHTAWERFATDEHLAPMQLEQFRTYAHLLISWNKTMNLTAITDPERIRAEHFTDSLILRNFLDFSKINGMLDVGTGAGFPAIPLKIVYPHLKVVLLEVNQKKQRFLAALIAELGLKNIEISGLDFKTFVRSTHGNIDLVVARASLDPATLVRIFSPDCAYKDALLVYWASAAWTPGADEGDYVRSELAYSVFGKNRKLIFMGKKNNNFPLIT